MHKALGFQNTVRFDMALAKTIFVLAYKEGCAKSVNCYSCNQVPVADTEFLMTKVYFMMHTAAQDAKIFNEDPSMHMRDCWVAGYMRMDSSDGNDGQS